MCKAAQGCDNFAFVACTSAIIRLDYCNLLRYSLGGPCFCGTLFPSDGAGQ